MSPVRGYRQYFYDEYGNLVPVPQLEGAAPPAPAAPAPEPENFSYFNYPYGGGAMANGSLTGYDTYGAMKYMDEYSALNEQERQDYLMWAENQKPDPNSPMSMPDIGIGTYKDYRSANPIGGFGAVANPTAAMGADYSNDTYGRYTPDWAGGGGAIANNLVRPESSYAPPQTDTVYQGGGPVANSAYPKIIDNRPATYDVASGAAAQEPNQGVELNQGSFTGPSNAVQPGMENMTWADLEPIVSRGSLERNNWWELPLGEQGQENWFQKLDALDGTDYSYFQRLFDNNPSLSWMNESVYAGGRADSPENIALGSPMDGKPIWRWMMEDGYTLGEVMRWRDVANKQPGFADLAFGTEYRYTPGVTTPEIERGWALDIWNSDFMKSPRQFGGWVAGNTPRAITDPIGSETGFVRNTAAPAIDQVLAYIPLMSPAYTQGVKPALQGVASWGAGNPFDWFINGAEGQKKLAVNSALIHHYGEGAAEYRGSWGDAAAEVGSSVLRFVGEDEYYDWLMTDGRGKAALEKYGKKNRIDPETGQYTSEIDYDAIWNEFLRQNDSLVWKMWQDYQLDPTAGLDLATIALPGVGIGLRAAGAQKAGTAFIRAGKFADTASILGADYAAELGIGFIWKRAADVLTPESVKAVRRAENVIKYSQEAAMSLTAEQWAKGEAGRLEVVEIPGEAMAADIDEVPAAAPSPLSNPLQSLRDNGYNIGRYPDESVNSRDTIGEVFLIANQETGRIYYIVGRAPRSVDTAGMTRLNPVKGIWRPMVIDPVTNKARYITLPGMGSGARPMTLDEAAQIIARFDAYDMPIPASRRPGSDLNVTPGETAFDDAPTEMDAVSTEIPGGDLRSNGFTVERGSRDGLTAFFRGKRSDAYTVTAPDGQQYLLVSIDPSRDRSGLNKYGVYVGDPNSPTWRVHYIDPEDGISGRAQLYPGEAGRTQAEAELAIYQDYLSANDISGGPSLPSLSSENWEDEFNKWWNSITQEERDAFNRGEISGPDLYPLENLANRTGEESLDSLDLGSLAGRTGTESLGSVDTTPLDPIYNQERAKVDEALARIENGYGTQDDWDIANTWWAREHGLAVDVGDPYPGAPADGVGRVDAENLIGWNSFDEMYPSEGQQFGREADEMERQFEAWWQNASEEERLAYEAAVQRISDGVGTPEDWNIFYTQESQARKADPRSKDSGSPDNYWEETLQTLPGGTNYIEPKPPTEEDLLRLQEAMRETYDESSLNQDRIRMLEEKGANLTEDELQELWELIAIEYGYEGPPVDPKMFMDPNWQQAFLGDVNGTGLSDEQIVDNLWNDANPEFDSNAIRASMNNQGLLNAIARIADDLPEFEREEVFAILRNPNTNLGQKLRELEEWKLRQDPMTRLKLDEAMAQGPRPLTQADIDEFPLGPYNPRAYTPSPDGPLEGTTRYNREILPDGTIATGDIPNTPTRPVSDPDSGFMLNSLSSENKGDGGIYELPQKSQFTVYKSPDGREVIVAGADLSEYPAGVFDNLTEPVELLDAYGNKLSSGPMERSYLEAQLQSSRHTKLGDDATTIYSDADKRLMDEMDQVQERAKSLGMVSSEEINAHIKDGTATPEMIMAGMADPMSYVDSGKFGITSNWMAMKDKGLWDPIIAYRRMRIVHEAARQYLNGDFSPQIQKMFNNMFSIKNADGSVLGVDGVRALLFYLGKADGDWSRVIRQIKIAQPNPWVRIDDFKELAQQPPRSREELVDQIREMYPDISDEELYAIADATEHMILDNPLESGGLLETTGISDLKAQMIKDGSVDPPRDFEELVTLYFADMLPEGVMDRIASVEKQMPGMAHKEIQGYVDTGEWGGGKPGLEDYYRRYGEALIPDIDTAKTGGVVGREGIDGTVPYAPDRKYPKPADLNSLSSEADDDIPYFVDASSPTVFDPELVQDAEEIARASRLIMERARAMGMSNDSANGLLRAVQQGLDPSSPGNGRLGSFQPATRTLHLWLGEIAREAVRNGTLTADFLLRRTVNHELMHALRASGAMSEEDFQVLVKWAKEIGPNGKPRHNVDIEQYRRYYDSNPGVQKYFGSFDAFIEDEMVASAFGTWRAGLDDLGRVSKIWEGIRNVVDQFMAYFRSNPSSRTVLRNVESGKYSNTYKWGGGQTPEEVVARKLRTAEQESAKNAARTVFNGRRWSGNNRKRIFSTGKSEQEIVAENAAGAQNAAAKPQVVYTTSTHDTTFYPETNRYTVVDLTRAGNNVATIRGEDVQGMSVEQIHEVGVQKLNEMQAADDALQQERIRKVVESNRTINNSRTSDDVAEEGSLLDEANNNGHKRKVGVDKDGKPKFKYFVRTKPGYMPPNQPAQTRSIEAAIAKLKAMSDEMFFSAEGNKLKALLTSSSYGGSDEAGRGLTGMFWHKVDDDGNDAGQAWEYYKDLMADRLLNPDTRYGALNLLRKENHSPERIEQYEEIVELAVSRGLDRDDLQALIGESFTRGLRDNAQIFHPGQFVVITKDTRGNKYKKPFIAQVVKADMGANGKSLDRLLVKILPKDLENIRGKWTGSVSSSQLEQLPGDPSMPELYHNLSFEDSVNSKVAFDRSNQPSATNGDVSFPVPGEYAFQSSGTLSNGDQFVAWLNANDGQVYITGVKDNVPIAVGRSEKEAIARANQSKVAGGWSTRDGNRSLASSRWTFVSHGALDKFGIFKRAEDPDQIVRVRALTEGDNQKIGKGFTIRRMGKRNHVRGAGAVLREADGWDHTYYLKYDPNSAGFLIDARMANGKPEFRLVRNVQQQSGSAVVTHRLIGTYETIDDVLDAASIWSIRKNGDTIFDQMDAVLRPEKPINADSPLTPGEGAVDDATRVASRRAEAAAQVEQFVKRENKNWTTKEYQDGVFKVVDENGKFIFLIAYRMDDGTIMPDPNWPVVGGGSRDIPEDIQKQIDEAKQTQQEAAKAAAEEKGKKKTRSKRTADPATGDGVPVEEGTPSGARARQEEEEARRAEEADASDGNPQDQEPREGVGEVEFDKDGHPRNIAAAESMVADNTLAELEYIGPGDLRIFEKKLDDGRSVFYAYSPDTEWKLVGKATTKLTDTDTAMKRSETIKLFEKEILNKIDKAKKKQADPSTKTIPEGYVEEDGPQYYRELPKKEIKEGQIVRVAKKMTNPRTGKEYIEMRRMYVYEKKTALFYGREVMDNGDISTMDYDIPYKDIYADERNVDAPPVWEDPAEKKARERSYKDTFMERYREVSRVFHPDSGTSSLTPEARNEYQTRLNAVMEKRDEKGLKQFEELAKKYGYQQPSLSSESDVMLPSLSVKNAVSTADDEPNLWDSPMYNPSINPTAKGGVIDRLGKGLSRARHRAHGRTMFQDVIDIDITGDEVIKPHAMKQASEWENIFGHYSSVDGEAALSQTITTKRGGGTRKIGHFIQDTVASHFTVQDMKNIMDSGRKLTKAERVNFQKALKQLNLGYDSDILEIERIAKMNVDELADRINKTIAQEIFVSEGIMTDEKYPKLVKQNYGKLQGVVDGLSAYTDFIRTFILHNRARGMVYPLTQHLGNSNAAGIVAPGALFHLQAPREFLKIRKEIKGGNSPISTEVESILKSAGLSMSPAINPRLRPGGMMRDQLGFGNDMPLEGLGPVGNAASKILFSKASKEMGDGGDILFRHAVWRDATEREFELMKTEVINWAKILVGRANKVNPGIIPLSDPQIEKALVDLFAQNPRLVTGKQIEDALINAAGPMVGNSTELNNFANRVGRDWINAVRKVRDHGDKEVNRIAHSFNMTHVDNVVGKFFLFHYWTSRQTKLYATEMLRKPWLANGLQSYISTMEREYEAHPERYGKYEKGMWQFWKTTLGLTVLGDPMSLLWTFVIDPGFIFGVEDSNKDRSFVGKAMDSSTIGDTMIPNPLKGMFLHPLVEAVAAALGVFGRDWRTPDVIGSSGMERQVIRMLEMAADANVHVPGSRDKNGNRIPIEYLTSEQIVRRAMLQFNRLFGEGNLNLPPAYGQRRIRDFRQAVFGAIYNDPVNAGKTTEELYDIMFLAVADPGSEYYKQGLAAITEKDQVDFVARLFSPYRVSTKTAGKQEMAMLNDQLDNGQTPFPTGDDLSSQEGSDIANIYESRLWDLINKENDLIPNLRDKVDDYYSMTPDSVLSVKERSDDIKYGTPFGGNIMVDGVVYSGAQIASLSYGERALLADRYIKSQLGKDGEALLKKSEEQQLEALRLDPELADFLGFTRLARTYNGTEEQFINQLARNNPEWAKWIAEQQNPLSAYKSAESWEILNQRGGDMYGPDAASDIGITPNLTGLGFEDDSKTLGQWYMEEIAGDEQELDEYKQGTLKEIEKAAALKAAMLELTGSDEEWKRLLETVYNGESYRIEDDALYEALKEYQVKGDNGKYYWLGIGAKDYIEWANIQRTADPSADISVDEYFLVSDAERGASQRQRGQSEFDPLTDAPTLIGAPSTRQSTATQSPTSGPTASIGGGGAMVSSGPGNGSPIAKLKPGGRYRIVSNNGEWSQIELPDGSTGWVETALLTK